MSVLSAQSYTAALHTAAAAAATAANAAV